MIRRLAVVAMLGLVAAGPAERKDGAQPRRARTGERMGQKQAKTGAKEAPLTARQAANARGNAFLRQGSARASIASFRKTLARDPDSVAAHTGLGRALTRVGRCDEALEHLEPYVGTKAFGPEAALAASTCAGRLGFLEDAVYYGEIAVELDAKSARAWTSLALAYDELGDPVGRDTAMEELLLLRDGRDSSWYAEGVMAIRAGDVDRFDGIAALWRRDNRSSLDLLRLEALSWLDLDDPQAAFDALVPVKTLQAGAQIRSLRAESLRRLGFPETASVYMEDRPNSVLEGPDADAVRARIQADLGDFAAARATLEEYGREPEDADVVASAWYLARETGDAATEAAMAQRYEVLRQSPLRDLRHLVPVSRRR
ncbi:MAG: tetratricopeptide repeat protein [Myxococcota bacterium]